MTYKDAMQIARRMVKNGIGASGILDGEPLLAWNVYIACMTHPGADPSMVYNGAIKKGLAPKDVRKLSGVGLADLMFPI